MSDKIRFHYQFDFGDQEQKCFEVVLDQHSLCMQPVQLENPPAWTALENHQCAPCQFASEVTPRCPIAANLAHIVSEFSDYLSHTEVQVQVTSAERTIVKKTDLQTGLTPLIGLVMACSGCPSMDKLKPMARFHLPFASLEETIMRSVSMYLISLLYQQRKGLEIQWSLEGMTGLYADVTEVNNAFAERLRHAAKRDANLNALVNLQCLGQLVPPSIEDVLAQMEGHFEALL